jgi:tripartite-type tricarboxylate transporter receptor subunit TctC
VGEAPLMLVIPPTAPQKNLKEVLDAARAQPDKWSAALPALGAPSHLATLLLAQQGRLKLTMVPYRGTAPALADVAGGHAQLLLDSIISLQGMARAGKVKAVAVSSAQRSTIAPDVPTAAESGFPGVVYNSWYGVWAPKGTPAERVQVLHRAINKATAELARSGAYTTLGILPVLESTEQFRQFVAADVARSAELLKEAGFKPE